MSEARDSAAAAGSQPTAANVLKQLVRVVKKKKDIKLKKASKKVLKRLQGKGWASLAVDQVLAAVKALVHSHASIHLNKKRLLWVSGPPPAGDGSSGGGGRARTPAAAAAAAPGTAGAGQAAAAKAASPGAGLALRVQGVALANERQGTSPKGGSGKRPPPTGAEPAANGTHGHPVAKKHRSGAGSGSDKQRALATAAAAAPLACGAVAAAVLGRRAGAATAGHKPTATAAAAARPAAERPAADGAGGVVPGTAAAAVAQRVTPTPTGASAPSRVATGVGQATLKPARQRRRQRRAAEAAAAAPAATGAAASGTVAVPGPAAAGPAAAGPGPAAAGPAAAGAAAAWLESGGAAGPAAAVAAGEAPAAGVAGPAAARPMAGNAAGFVPETAVTAVAGAAAGAKSETPAAGAAGTKAVKPMKQRWQQRREAGAAAAPGIATAAGGVAVPAAGAALAAAAAPAATAATAVAGPPSVKVAPTAAAAHAVKATPAAAAAPAAAAVPAVKAAPAAKAAPTVKAAPESVGAAGAATAPTTAAVDPAVAAARGTGVGKATRTKSSVKKAALAASNGKEAEPAARLASVRRSPEGGVEGRGAGAGGAGTDGSAGSSDGGSSSGGSSSGDAGVARRRPVGAAALRKGDEGSGPSGVNLERGSWRDDYQRGDIRHGPFTSAEKDAIWAELERYAEEHGLDVQAASSWLGIKAGHRGAFTAVAAALPQRTVKAVWACTRRIVNNKSSAMVGVKWTPDEDEQLLQAVQEHGHHWVEVGVVLGRRADQVRDRWRRLKDLGGRPKSGRWSTEESMRLQDSVNQYLDLKKRNEGAISAGGGNEREGGSDGGSMKRGERPDGRLILDDVDWGWVAQKVGRRNAQQCMEKWYDQLAPSQIDKGEWEASQDKTLVRALLLAGCQEEYQVDWGSLVPGRTAEQVRRRWRSMQRAAPCDVRWQLGPAVLAVAQIWFPRMLAKVQFERALVEDGGGDGRGAGGSGGSGRVAGGGSHGGAAGEAGAGSGQLGGGAPCVHGAGRGGDGGSAGHAEAAHQQRPKKRRRPRQQVELAEQVQ